MIKANVFRLSIPTMVLGSPPARELQNHAPSEIPMGMESSNAITMRIIYEAIWRNYPFRPPAGALSYTND